MSKRMAPTVWSILDAAESRMLGAESMALRQARREYQAMETAIAATRRVLTLGKGCGRKVCFTAFDEECPGMIKARRALARLDRVRGAKRGGGR